MDSLGLGLGLTMGDLFCCQERGRQGRLPRPLGFKFLEATDKGSPLL